MVGIIGEENAVTAYRACLQSIADIKKVVEETGVNAGYEKLRSLFMPALRQTLSWNCTERLVRK